MDAQLSAMGSHLMRASFFGLAAWLFFASVVGCFRFVRMEIASHGINDIVGTAIVRYGFIFGAGVTVLMLALL
jgi:branched-subunit amino acid transport protein AzlD